MTSPSTPAVRPGPARSAVLTVLLVAAVVGFLAGALAATTLGQDDAPALPTAAPTPTPAPTTEPPAPSAAPPVTWALTLLADRDRAAPLELIRLTGRLDPPRAGVTLQVQRSRDGGPYEDFPVTTTTGQDGEFGTWVRTQREGRSQFRVVTDLDGQQVVSNVAGVEIG